MLKCGASIRLVVSHFLTDDGFDLFTITVPEIEWVSCWIQVSRAVGVRIGPGQRNRRRAVDWCMMDVRLELQ
jgi:hypothetical protein